MGILAPRGKAKHLVLGSLVLMLAACAACLSLGVLALLQHQPYGVWYGLLLPGILGLVLFPSLTPVVLMRYREAETGRCRRAISDGREISRQPPQNGIGGGEGRTVVILTQGPE